MIFYCSLSGITKKYARGAWYTRVNGRWQKDKRAQTKTIKQRSQNHENQSI